MASSSQSGLLLGLLPTASGGSHFPIYRYLVLVGHQGVMGQRDVLQNSNQEGQRDFR